MTTTEYIVIGGGLLLGYWLVGLFVPMSRKGAPTEPETGNGPEAPSGNGRDDQATDEGATGASAHRPSGQAWFDVLEVSEVASPEEISAAYKTQISQYHPDKVAKMGRDIRQLAESRSKSINAAYAEAMRRRT